MRTFVWISFVLMAVGVSSAAAETKNAPSPMTVPQAIATALANNPRVKEADANIAAAMAAAQSARAQMLPEASFSYGYNGVKEKPVMKIAGTATQVRHEHLYGWDVTVVQPLFTGFALASKLRIAELNITARELEKDQVALDLRREVKSACYQVLLSNRLLKVSDDEVAALTAHRHNAALYFNQGLIRKNDLLRADVALAEARQTQETAAGNLRKAIIRLNRLMNRPPRMPLSLCDVALPLSPTFRQIDDIDALCTAALRDRPLIQLLGVGLEQLGYSVKMEKSAWYPAVSLVGQYEQSGENPAASDNAFSNTHNAAISAQLEWKFWQSGKTRADVSAAREKIKALAASIEGYEHQILEEVHTARLDCTVASKNLETAATALDQARENQRTTNMQYREQVALSSDVLDATSFLSRADTNYYRAAYGYLDAVAALERTTGKR